MYPDTILFMTGIVFTAATLFFVIYLLVSRKRSRVYTEALKQESEGFDAITALLSSTVAPAPSFYTPQNPYSYNVQPNCPVSDGYTDRLYSTGLPGENNQAYNPAYNPAYKPGPNAGFRYETISGAYVIEREISGGAMSRTFQVRSLKLGNPWFLKFIPSVHGGPANEVNILKLLNHVSLPKIIDVYHREEGLYLVTTLIDGLSLDRVMQTGVKISQHVLLDWFEQMTQALNYLHSMKPSPIFHLDLKPGNIMVTHDNRLVLVDFGIARRIGENIPSAITAAYAAPEQFGGCVPDKYAQLVYERFGDITNFPRYSTLDARTDIFSLGVIMFELATGRTPTLKNIGALKNTTSAELGAIIRKCLAINPIERYQSADKLLDDLRKVKGIRLKMARILLNRRLATVAASLSLLISGGTYAGGYYLYNEENMAVVSAKPEIVTVSLQQTSGFTVSKQMADGRVVFLDSGQMVWEYSADNIARIDGDRVSGINEGETVIRGRYRNREVELTVRVVRPVDGMVNVSLQYEPGRYVSLYAGHSVRTRMDGPLESANFMSPESITVAEDGTVYLTDDGEIRMISGGLVSTLSIPVSYIKASMVRAYENELYLLSNPWQDGDRYFYTIARFGDDGLEALYVADALYTAVEDFTFGSDGLLYFIDRNEGLGDVYLKTLNLFDVGDITTLVVLPAGSTSLAVATNGDVYIGNTDSGVIQIYRNGRLEFFAGIEGERVFVDGSSPRFYLPQRLEHRGGYLYIWDFNTLRRIEATRGVAGECITIAGIATPDFDMEFEGRRTPAEDVILPYGSLMDFTFSGRGILLTDHKRGVVWEIWN